MWTRHRDEVATLSVDFSAPGWLASGETISGPIVKVFRRVGRSWTEVTTDFVDGGATVEGTIVSWKKKAGSALTQPAKGAYAVKHTVTTNQGQTLVYNEDLRITDKAAI